MTFPYCALFVRYSMPIYWCTLSTLSQQSLYFYLTSPVFQDDYLAVEMINRKIRFVWSLGGEPGEVTHPMHIQTAGDLANDQHWYKIEVQR